MVKNFLSKSGQASHLLPQGSISSLRFFPSAISLSSLGPSLGTFRALLRTWPRLTWAVSVSQESSRANKCHRPDIFSAKASAVEPLARLV